VFRISKPFYPFLFAFLIFPLAGLQAQELGAFSQKVQTAYEAASDLQMDFVQKTYVALLEKEVSKRGKAEFKKPGKFKIRYEGDRARNYVCNGKELYYFETGDKQVQKFPVDDDTVPAEALSFLGGLGNLQSDFVIEEVDSKKEAQLKKEKKNLRWMELTPRKKRSSIDWLVMGFDPDSALMQELFIFTDSGNLSHYVFGKVEANTGLKDAEFEYKK